MLGRRAAFSGLAAFAALLALALLSSVGVVAQGENVTIAEYLSQDERFTTLVELLEQEGLLQELNSTDANYTIFAPTNEAFDQYQNRTQEKQDDANDEEEEYELSEILSYHVVEGEFDRERLFTDLQNGEDDADDFSYIPLTFNECVNEDAESWRELNNESALISRTLPTLLTLDTLADNPQRIKVIGNAEQSFIVVNWVNVTEDDIQVSNGFINIIDAVLEPPKSVPRVVENLPLNFTEFLTLLNDTDTVDTLTVENATIFLPVGFGVFENEDCEDNETDTTIDATGELVRRLMQDANETEIRELLQRHVVYGQVIYTDDLLERAREAQEDDEDDEDDEDNQQTGPVQDDEDDEDDEDDDSVTFEYSTAADTQLNITVYPNGTIMLKGEEDEEARVLRNPKLFDIPTRTGVIHVISAALVPREGELLELLRSLNATRLAEELQAAGLVGQLEDGEEYTIFAPTNLAIAAAGDDVDEETLLVHVVPGKPDIVNAAELQPLFGPEATLLINRDAAAFTVRVLEVETSFANIVDEAEEGNFAVYLIDRVLIPPQ